MQENRSDSLRAWVDLARWLAAFSVLLTHVGLRMLVPVTDMPSFSWPHAAYAFAAGFDHQAVMVFFVLSGFLVGGAALQDIRHGQFSATAYVQRRTVRLCIVLWPALALAAGCTAAALALGATGLGILSSETAATLGVPVLLCNAAFLQTAACPQFAGNGALWSLFNEAWYYLLFPPLALALFGRMHRSIRLALGSVAAAALAGLTAVQFTGSPIGPYMLVWAAGVAASALSQPLVRRPWLAALLFAAGSLAVRLGVRRAFAGLHPLLSAELDLLLSLLFANLLLSARCCGSLRPPPWPGLHAALAGFSFSLYCTHVPVLVLYVTVLVRLTGTGWQMAATGLTPWLAVAGALALCLAAGWVFAQGTEAHTDRLRRWLVRRRLAGRLA